MLLVERELLIGKQRRRRLAAGQAQQIADRLVPFLTSKHSLDYCLMYADRASAHGFGALTVLGGDRTVGQPILG